jgi:hypothetical protein
VNDPIVSAAFSIGSRKGVFALLIASGVSRSAMIPTGWEIVSHLIRRVAQATGKDCGSDPAEWYRKEYGKEPDYSELLEALSKSPATRSTILRRYFEPTEAERESGDRIPKAAHKAIAELVAAGYIRVIVTTNFDRLLEQALQEKGIAATVISTPDQAEGALPLAHSNCTIIKVNGDYLDTRIRNTTMELAAYDQRFDNLLDRVFDEYGLVICGWSATWDVALRTVLERCKNRRFSTFWCTVGGLSDPAKRVVKARDAQLIEIIDADSFFQNLSAKVTAIADFDTPHPLSATLASAMLKRYLVDPNQRIKLYDLISGETEKACNELTNNNFPAEPIPSSAVAQEEFAKRVHRYEGLTQVLAALFATGCYWGESGQENHWVKSLERVANAIDFQGGWPVWNELRFYPALLLLYAGGLAAVASDRYYTLEALLAKPRYKGNEGTASLYEKLLPERIITNNGLARILLTPDRSGRVSPRNEYLHGYFRSTLRELLPSDSDYDEVFDRFEFLLCANYVHRNRKAIASPAGRFLRDYSVLSFSMNTIGKKMRDEVEKEQNNWPPLKGGMFDGSTTHFHDAMKRVEAFLKNMGS